MSESLRVEREGRVLRLVLDRPEKRNALNEEMCGALLSQLRAAAEDRTVGSVLLTGAGPMFCSGMDLDEATAPGAVDLTAAHADLFTLHQWYPKPVVAAVQGPAMGGGVGLIATCHVAVAPHNCTFALSEIRIGMWPFAIYDALVHALGPRKTLYLSLTGRIFSGQEALQWGLLHEVPPQIEFEERSMDIAAHLAGFSPAALARGLRFHQQYQQADDPMKLALAMRAEAFASADFQEGVAAVKEKRPPVWQGL